MDTSPQNLQLLAALLSRSSSAAQPQLHALQTIPTTSQVSYANAPSPLEQLLLQSSSSPSLLQSPLALAALVASNAALPRSRSPAALTERQRFVIFVKVLFKYMDRLNNSLSTLLKIEEKHGKNSVRERKSSLKETNLDELCQVDYRCSTDFNYHIICIDAIFRGAQKGVFYL